MKARESVEEEDVEVMSDFFSYIALSLAGTVFPGFTRNVTTRKALRLVIRQLLLRSK